MKKLILALCVLIMINVIIPNNRTFACDNFPIKYVENDIVYTLDELDHTASVFDVKNVNSEKIVIPDNVSGYKIVSVSEKAFGKPIYKKWNTIILPDSIVKIGNRAFNFCPELKFIKLPQNLETIGSESFRLCTNLETLTLPDTVNSIGEEAFFSCVSLRSINIPDNLTALEKGLFQHCISLKGIHIHKNIKKISPNIFDECGVNLCLRNTIIDDDNITYKTQGNSIVNKESGEKILEYPTLNHEYISKKLSAMNLRLKMDEFIKKANNCSIEDFDRFCLDFLEKTYIKPNLLSPENFEIFSKNKTILYRGLSSNEYVNNFKSGKMFFSDNLSNERGSGIYSTSQYNHAEIWIWPTEPDYYIVLEQYENDDNLYKEMAYKLVPHGEVVKMYIDDSAKILNNTYLKEIKDLIFKTEPQKFRNIIAYGDCNFPKSTIKGLNIFNTKEQLLFHNSGILTKLLGYDILYEKETFMEIDEQGNLGDEYLIINPGILNILAGPTN